MKKHYETHVEDTDKLISVAGPELDYKSWYEQYRKLMEEQAQRKYGLYTPTSEGDDDDFPSIPGTIARYSALGLTNEQMAANPVWVDKTGNGHDLQMKNFAWGGMSGVGGYEMNFNLWTNNVPSISDISMSKTTTSVSVSVGNSAYNNNLIYIHIVYIPPMEIFKDKYYIQNGIKYKCTRNSEQPLTHDLSALVGLYVETI